MFQVNQNTLCEYLRSENLLTAEVIEKSLNLATRQSLALPTILRQTGVIAEHVLADVLANICKIDVVDTARLPKEAIQTKNISANFLYRTQMLPLSKKADKLHIAVVNPLDDTSLNLLVRSIDVEVSFSVITHDQWSDSFSKLYGIGSGETTDNPLDLEEDLEALVDRTSDVPVVQFFQATLNKAIQARASDIHFESTESDLIVRYRIDGILYNQPVCPSHLAAALISRIKILSGMDIAESRLPQDGRIHTDIEGRNIDIRVATLPVIEGERVVMRLLDRSSVCLDINKIGFNDRVRDTIIAQARRPNGIIFVTGRTGAGKTTSLYSLLEFIKTDKSNIITVEDPVEYRLDGINQVQVNATIDLSFANTLRSILRQDPDIIMVGEIRDKTTASMAIQAALTGHLVLSTLHTNNAVDSVYRLLDMGIEDYLIAATLNAVLAQDIVRRLCQHCRQPYSVDEIFLHYYQGNVDSQQQIYRSQGCSECNNTGFSGRLPITELMCVDDELTAQIRNNATGIRDFVEKKKDIVSMMQDGLEKVLQGHTCLDEILRVSMQQ